MLLKTLTFEKIKTKGCQQIKRVFLCFCRFIIRLKIFSQFHCLLQGHKTLKLWLGCHLVSCQAQQSPLWLTSHPASLMTGEASTTSSGAVCLCNFSSAAVVTDERELQLRDDDSTTLYYQANTTFHNNNIGSNILMLSPFNDLHSHLNLIEHWNHFFPL